MVVGEETNDWSLLQLLIDDRIILLLVLLSSYTSKFSYETTGPYVRGIPAKLGSS